MNRIWDENIFLGFIFFLRLRATFSYVGIFSLSPLFLFPNSGLFEQKRLFFQKAGFFDKTFRSKIGFSPCFIAVSDKSGLTF